MRLLQFGTDGGLTFTKDLEHEIPPYAILPHTWEDAEDEVTFQDIVDKTGTDKLGYEKITFCGNQARVDNLEYFWVDTCCINKTNSAELSKSINSMFRWYRDANVCYVYLMDVSKDRFISSKTSRATWQQQFQNSKWFCRGWTLQELVAPTSVRFYDCNGSILGDKAILADLIHNITGITETALLGAPITNFWVSERYDWARNRETTQEEDCAYSLLGIFGVFLPPIYGEGRQYVVHRLLKEITEECRNHYQM
ncbi:heterokaryon incompatibility protein-domain-containing protein [Xylariales sp. PMI_506]|nr:heterokaryon incompatibility protein-domain-containing protein [Xylariales sp. PMI_506]